MGSEIDPTDPVELAKWNALKQKYAGNLPKIGESGALDKRMEWTQWAKQKLPTSGTPAELAAKASEATGLNNPGLLLSSAMEEGVGSRFKGDEAYSRAYDEANTKGELKDYPVDAFRTYGLDQIGGRVDEFVKKGYLPQGFQSKMKPFKAANEIDEKEYYTQAAKIAQQNNLVGKDFKFKADSTVYDQLDTALKGYKGQLPTLKKSANTAAFVDDESAFMAKAAFMRAEQENVSGYAKKKGYNLTPQEQDFFTLASYNAGQGGGQKMIDFYGGKKLLGTDGFLKERDSARGKVYDNILPRYAGANLFNKEGYFAYGGTMPKKPKYQYGTEDPIEDPILGTTGPQLDPNAKRVGIDVWKNAANSPVPINPNAPPNEQIFQIQPQPGSSSPQNIVDPFGTRTLAPGAFQGGFANIDRMQTENREQQELKAAADRAKYEEGQQNRSDAELAATTGITAVNAFFNKEGAGKQKRKNRRAAIMQQFDSAILNPYLEGTGSQAIFKKGGKIPIGYHKMPDGSLMSNEEMKYSGELSRGDDYGSNQGVQTTDGGKTKIISGNNHSNPMMEFTGKEHSEGGIGVAYGGQIAEVENKEIGWVDQQGGLNIFGKLKLPGTNQTFKKTAKDLADRENKVDGMMSKYLNILNNSDPTDKYQESAQSTAKVMFKSLDKQSKEISEKKEALSSYQNLILSMVDDGDEDDEEMAYGGKMPKNPFRKKKKRKKYAEGGAVDPDEDDKIKKIADAIGQFESGNKYDSLGVVVSKGRYKGQRAIGKYQIMEGNLADWSKEALGKSVTKEEFLASPEIQDKIAHHKMGEIYKQYKNPQDVASVWFTGRPTGGSAGKATDDMGTSGNQYVKSVMDIYNAGGPGDDKFKMENVDFSRPDAKVLYSTITGDDEDPRNTPGNKDLARLERYLGIGATTNAANIDNTNIQGTTAQANSLGLEPPYQPINTNQTPGSGNGAIGTPHGPAEREVTPFSDKANIGAGNRTRGYISPLAIEQIAPELLTMATNRRDPVEQLTYQPDLQQTFDLSYQLGRNENQSTFNQAARIAEQTGNIDALSQLAAQKYKADEAYNMQEIQGNAQQKLGVYAQNINVLNDAKVKNLALIADQQVKQAQAKFNTRKEDISAFTSISTKVAQNKLENRTYNAYATLFKNFGFDKKGVVTFNPDEVVTKFDAGEAQQFGMLAAQQGAGAIMNGDFSRQFKKVKNEDGSTTTTETLGRNKKIQEKYKTLKAQGHDDTIIGNMLKAEFPETITQD